MVRVKTDYHSTGYPHREHRAGKTRRKNHLLKRRNKIQKLDFERDGDRKQHKFKK